MKRVAVYLVLVVAVGIGTAIVGRHSRIPSSVRGNATSQPLANLADRARKDPARADEIYRKYIDEESKSNPASAMQAQMSLAFSISRRGDYKEAAAVFRDLKSKADKTKISATNNLSLEAEYESAVCEEAGGQKMNAYADFKKIITNHPMSDYVYGAGKRMREISGGDLQPGDEELIEACIQKQEEAGRLAAVDCGPQVLAEILRRRGRTAPSIQELTAICGTDAKGTSVAGMRKALKGFGMTSYAATLNRESFSKLSTPTIWLIAGHYVLITALSNTNATIFDPSDSKTKQIPLPADDDSFQADVITFSTPDI